MLFRRHRVGVQQFNGVSILSKTLKIQFLKNLSLVFHVRNSSLQNAVNELNFVQQVAVSLHFLKEIPAGSSRLHRQAGVYIRLEHGWTGPIRGLKMESWISKGIHVQLIAHYMRTNWGQGGVTVLQWNKLCARVLPYLWWIPCKAASGRLKPWLALNPMCTTFLPIHTYDTI